MRVASRQAASGDARPAGRRCCPLAPLAATALATLALAAAASVPAALQAASTPRVGLVLSGGIQDPFEGLAYRGLVRAVNELGVQGRVLVAGPNEGTLPSMSYLARRGYDLVIDVGEIRSPISTWRRADTRT